jgi:hypothetical protein
VKNKIVIVTINFLTGTLWAIGARITEDLIYSQITCSLVIMREIARGQEPGLGKNLSCVLTVIKFIGRFTSKGIFTCYHYLK